MGVAGGDGGGLGAERDAPGEEGDIPVADVVGVAVAELAVGSVAPAAEAAGGQQGAGVILAGGDGDGATPELDVAGAGGGLVVPDVVGVAVAQLPVGAGAPAADVAGAQQGAGVVAAGGDGGGLGAEGMFPAVAGVSSSPMRFLLP
ncbi:MAG: hypothetical protein R2693_04520 [Nocardioidaceae bacterium]